ncbi:response regulator transcription factor [Actinoplanes subglobosus]|uniref:Response regulator transcription factor n=1 Tax=Actinoplanes subglobosus TaxID=1547892 RepID=A0ABV8J9B4_9ACTN
MTAALPWALCQPQPLPVTSCALHAGTGKTIFMNDIFRTAPRRSRQTSELTDREVQVLTLVSHGKTNKQIGAVLYLSPATIHSHLKKVFRKLDANDRAHAVAQAFRAGMLQ